MADVTLTTPLDVPDPTKKYGAVKIFLSIAPREVGDGTVDYVASCRLVPYRVVNGVVLDAPESMTKTVNIGTIEGTSTAQKFVQDVLVRVTSLARGMYS